MTEPLNPEAQLPSSETGQKRPAASWGPGSQTAGDIDEVNFLELVNIMRRRWKLLVGLPLLAALIAAVVALGLPAVYTATATFAPETGSGGVTLPSGLAGFAQQFGLGASGGANSTLFYVQVLESRTVADEVLRSRFPDYRSTNPADSATLLDILEIAGATETASLARGRGVLARATTVSNMTGIIVRVSVETRYPHLSADVANRFIDLLNKFNLEVRQSSARARRRFTEERVRETEAELRDQEEELRRFLETNRQFAGSPVLTFQHERLQRRVVSKQEVVTALRRQYEEAKIAEVNDAHAITVVDRAVPPDMRSRPRRKRIVLLWFTGAVVLAGFIAFTQEYVTRARE